MTKKTALVIVDLQPAEMAEFTLDEFCGICQITPDFMQEIISHGIIEPDVKQSSVYFNQAHVRRVRTLIHLQQDLEVNLPGAALAIELMDEIEQLRKRMETFERYFEK